MRYFERSFLKHCVKRKVTGFMRWAERGEELSALSWNEAYLGLLARHVEMGLMFVFPLLNSAAKLQWTRVMLEKNPLFCFFTPSISSIMDESHISASSTGPSFTNAFLETCACSTKELFKIYVLLLGDLMKRGGVLWKGATNQCLHSFIWTETMIRAP